MPYSGNVDERILEMQIDHQKFESGAKKTLSILERLDQGLKSIGSKNADGFDSITASLGKVTDKISVFGTIGDQVIRTLTNKVMDLVGQLGHLSTALTIDQIAAGWDKYGEKTQGVQTIMSATSKDWSDQGAQMEYVNGQLEKLNWFTDETSYSFLDMVNNIGKFTSNGVKLDTAVTAMEGISTWAALSGANVQEAGRAMYNLSQAMATGSVKLIDWKSIENANMATREFKETALETAVTLGTLEKAGDGTYKIIGKDTEDAYFTAEKFNSMLQEGWFTSDVLLQTLDKYGSFTDALNAETTKLDLTATEFLSAMEAYKEGNMDELQKIAKRTGISLEDLKESVKKLSDEQYELGYRAFKAAQEAKTFKEAVDATKDAVSTGWMNIWETIFGNYLEAKELWTELAETLYNVFAEPVNKIIELVDRAFKFNGIEESAEAAVDPTNELGEYLLKAGLDATRFVDTLNEIDPDLGQEIADKYGSIDAAFKAGAIDAETFRKVLEKLAEYGTGRQVDELGPDGKEINLENQSVVSEEAAKRLEAYNFLLENGTELLDRWTEKATEAGELGEEKVPGGQLFREGLVNLMHTVNDVSFAFLDAFDRIFGSTDERGDALYDLIVKFNEFTKSLTLSEKEVEGLSDKIAGKLAIFKAIGDAVSNVAKAFKNVFQGLLTPIKFIFELISGFFGQHGLTGIKLVESTVGSLSEKVLSLSERFRNFMTSSDTLLWIAQRFQTIATIVNRLIAAFKQGGLSAAFKELSDSLKDVLADHPVLLKVFTIISNVGQTLYQIFKGIAAPIKIVIRYISNLFTLMFGISKSNNFSWFQTFLDFLSNVSEKLKDASAKFSQFMQSAEVQKWIADRFRNLIAIIKAVGEALGKLNLKETFKNFKLGELFEGFSFDNIWDSLKNLASKIGEIISSIFGNLFAENGPLSYLKKFIGPALLALIGLGVYKGIRKVNGVINGVGDVVENISKITKKAAKGPSKFKQFATTLLMIAASIGIIAAAFIGISKLSWDNLLKGWLGITAILLSMMLFMSKADTAKGTGGWALIGMALTVVILAATLKSLAKLSWDDLLKGWLAITGILLSMMLFMSKADTAKGTGGWALIGMALTVVILAATLKSLAKLSWDDLLKGWLAITGILLSMMLFMSKADTAKGTGGWALIGMALTVVILAATLKSLAKLSWDDLLKGWLAITGILLSMMLFMSKADTAKGTGGWALIGMALTVVILAATLKSLAVLDFKQLLTGWLGITAILLSMMLFMKYAESSTISLKSILVLAGAAVAISLLAIPLSILAKFDWKSLLAAGVAMALCFITIITAVSILSAMSPGTAIKGLLVLAIIVGGIALIIWGLIEIGNGIINSAIKMADKLAQFAESLKPFAESISGFSDADSSNFDRFADMMLSIMVAEFWTMIASWLAKLGDSEALASSLTSFIEGVQPFLTDVVNVTKESVAGAENLSAMMGALVGGQAFAVVGSWLDGLDAEYGTKLSDFMGSLDGFLSNVGTINETHLSGAGFLSLIMGTLLSGEVWGKLGDFVNGLNAETGQKLSDFMGGMQGFLENVSSIDESKLEGASNLTSIMQKAFGANFWGTIGDLFSGNNVEYAEKMSAFTGALIPFLTNISAIDTGVLEKARSALTTFSIWNQDNTIANFGVQIDQFYKKLNGKNAGGDLTGLQSAISMFAEFADAITKLSGIDGIPAGLSIIDSVDNGIKAGSANLTLTLIVTIQNAVNDIGGGVYDAAYSNGLAIGDGTAAGIYASTGAAVAAAVAMANAINAAFSTTLDIHSPSRVFRRLAGFIPAGVAEGIEDKTWMAEDSITILASGVVAAMQQAMARVAMIADEDFDISPRITPVVDMSNLTSAAGNAGSLFDNIGTRMRGSMRVSMDTAQNTASAMKYGSGTDTIVDEIQRLSTRLEQLGDAVTGMQIVLDTGTLVGATSRKMDNAFGVMQARKGRGN